MEVFPPSFEASESGEAALGLRQKTRDFVERVRRIQSLADAIVVADVKDPSRIRLSTIQCASLLNEQLGIQAIPVITARDSNRKEVRSSIIGAYSLGIRSLMLVWGDRYSRQDGIKNVFDFPSLAQIIAEARKLGERAGVKCNILAPVDMSRLNDKEGVKLARSRLHAGADFLLAQPPMVDASGTLWDYEAILQNLDLKAYVVPNVFPFRDEADILACRQRFGWSIPERMIHVARLGEAELLKEARRVARKLQERDFPGVYVSTRGRPELARFILD